MATAPETERDALARAAEWFALLGAPGEPVADADRDAWQRWIDASPAHAAAWRQVEALNARFQRLKSQVDDVPAASRALQAVRVQQPARRRNLKLLGGVAVAGGAGWLGWRAEPWQDLVADAHTATGERRDLHLPDGTRLWMNTDTAVQWHYDDQERLVRLLRGEVLIETAPDPRGRPWRLALDEGALRPLGTRFSVWRDEDQCRLAVFEGRVAVQPATATRVTATLSAGEQTRFSRETVQPPSPCNDTLSAWTRGMLVADNQPLAELCRDLRRHHHLIISCDDAVAGLRVVGAFPLDDPTPVFDALARTLPIKVSRPLPWWIRIEPA